jgi:hypothetical protein
MDQERPILGSESIYEPEYPQPNRCPVWAQLHAFNSEKPVTSPQSTQVASGLVSNLRTTEMKNSEI